MENQTITEITPINISEFGKEFENCTFKDCDFSNCNLSAYRFLECRFNNCNLSMAKLNDAVIRECSFDYCKLLGLNLFECNDFIFTASFDNCLMKYASFKGMNLKSFKFSNCNLEESDFFGTDLSNSVFENCILQRAIFSDTNLEKADLRTAINFTIDPDRNKIKKARFSRLSLSGLLDKFNIIIE